MKIKIYQIDTARDKNRVKFMGLKELSKYRGRSEIDASLYNEVFSGEVDCKDLEEVYEMFNLEPHPLHRGILCRCRTWWQRTRERSIATG
ncbi:MAG: YodL domain-containing protein [Christensenellaceae bacterium]